MLDFVLWSLVLVFGVCLLFRSKAKDQRPGLYSLYSAAPATVATMEVTK